MFTTEPSALLSAEMLLLCSDTSWIMFELTRYPTFPLA